MEWINKLILAIVFMLFSGIGITAMAQNGTETDSIEYSSRELPLEPARTVHLETNEGTWISLDVHPDGKRIIFDLMGDLYELPISGGEAEQLTNGMAFDSQPIYSPGGTKVAYISDRSGGGNVWILDLETMKAEQLTFGNNYRMQSPVWTPDGQYIIAARAGVRNGLHKFHMYHIEGGSGIEFMGTSERLKTIGAAFGGNDQYLWFSRRRGDWEYNATFPQYQLAKFDRETGEIHNQTARLGSAFRPTLSSDGKWLVYGTRHETETGLRIRNLKTGDERWLAYPVQRDDMESRATLGVLPRMSFTPDNKAVIASFGGRIWRIPIAKGAKAEEIPFKVDTKLELGPRLDFQYPIKDTEQFTARQIRDAVPSPDGSQLAFTVLNDLYVMDLPDGEPKHITDLDITEAFPTWSPNGEWIAFSTWNPEAGGHIYRVQNDGDDLERLTEQSAIYQQLAWSKTQDRIVAIRGEDRMYYQSPGAYMPFDDNELVWISPEGGPARFISSTEGLENPHFIKNDDRIYLSGYGEGLVSMRYDGTDKQTHVKIKGATTPGEDEPRRASIILMAPEGDKALAQIGSDIYAVTIPRAGDAPAISVAKPDKASFPASKLTDIGGQFPAWDWDGNKVHWSIGNGHFMYDLDAAAQRERKQERYDAEKEQEEDKDSEDGEDKDKGDSEDDEKEEDPNRPKDYKPEELRIRIDINRDVPEGALVLRGARVITMKGDQVIENGDIVIQDNRIKAVGERGSVEIPSDAEIRDVSGKTIIPGFVDTHAHVRPTRNLHRRQVWSFLANLAYGVTTLRDPQTGTTDLLTYADMVKSGELTGPRIYQTGPGVFWSEQIEDLDHARDVLKRYSEYYDTKSIKMYVAGNREQRQWILKAAKEQKLMPTTEGSLNMKLNMTMLIDGYPGQEHNFPITPIYQDMVKTTAEAKMAYTPTLLVTYGGPWAENYFYAHEDPSNNQKLKYFTPQRDLYGKARRRDAGWFHEDEYVMDRQSQTVKKIYDAGGLLGVGSHGQLQGLGYHWELWAMSWADMDPHKALRIATILGAKSLGLDDDIGSIEEGKLADLLILSKNPLENIRNTTSIKHVMKNGRLYNADNLNQVWPSEQKAGTLWYHRKQPKGVPGLHLIEE